MGDIQVLPRVYVCLRWKEVICYGSLVIMSDDLVGLDHVLDMDVDAFGAWKSAADQRPPLPTR